MFPHFPLGMFNRCKSMHALRLIPFANCKNVVKLRHADCVQGSQCMMRITWWGKYQSVVHISFIKFIYSYSLPYLLLLYFHTLQYSSINNQKSFYFVLLKIPEIEHREFRRFLNFYYTPVILLYVLVFFHKIIYSWFKKFFYILNTI